MFDKRLVRHTVTMIIHINVSSQSTFFVWKRNCGYSVCEGGTAGLEAKAHVWNRNCRTSSRSIFLVWKRNYLPSITSCAEAEFQTLKSHNILCARAELRNLKSQYITSAEAVLRHRVTIIRQRIFRVRKQNLKSQHIPYVEAELWNFKSQNSLGVKYLWFLMQWFERYGSAGPQVHGSKPSWWCYLLAMAHTGMFLLSFLLSSSNKSAVL